MQCSSTSGAWYDSDPTNYSLSRANQASFSSMAQLKSPILTLRSVIKILLGSINLCTTPCSWMCLYPLIICLIQLTAFSSANAPVLSIYFSRSPPQQYSQMMNTILSLRCCDIICTIFYFPLNFHITFISCINFFSLTGSLRYVSGYPLKHTGGRFLLWRWVALQMVAYFYWEMRLSEQWQSLMEMDSWRLIILILQCHCEGNNQTVNNIAESMIEEQPGWESLQRGRWLRTVVITKLIYYLMSSQQYRPTIRSALLTPNIVDNPKPVQIINITRAAFLCFIICLSPVYYGYSLTIIGASNLTTLFFNYNITLSKQATLALLNGMLGCLLFPKVRLLATKKKLHYYLTFGSLLVSSLTVIPSFAVLIVCRFLLGVLSAQYMALAMNLIKEHFTDQQWKPFGAVYSAMRILGILLAYIIGQIFEGNTTRAGNITLFFGPTFISIIQTVMIGYNLPESPVELLRANETIKAGEALELLFSREDSAKRLNQLQLKIKRSVPSKFDTVSNPMNLCALHLALLRQFCGVTYLVVYASQIPIHTQTTLGSVGFVVENTIQMVGGMVGVPMVMYCSRYKMVVVTTALMVFLNLALALGSIFQIASLAFGFICVSMFVCSAGLTSVIWSYPSELATPGLEKWGAVTSMGGTALVTIVPPFVVGVMPNGQAYPIFFFFALYLIAACVLNDYLLPRDKLQSQTVEIELALGA